MRLTLEHLHWYLLDKGFITPGSLVSGDYLATQAQTRNAIFRVVRRHDKGLFIKQVVNFDATSAYVLQKDATCMWLIKNHPAFERFAESVPDYFGFDAEKQVLVTEYLAKATNLEDYSRQREGVLPEMVLDDLAGVLASFHFSLKPDVLEHRSVQFFLRQQPWVFNLIDNGPAMQQLLQHPSAKPVLDAVLGNASFREALLTVRERWAPTSLIHGDIKWMNLMVDQTEEGEKIKIIDWEFADIGDPLWDVAGAFQDIIAHIVFHHPSLATSASLVAGIGLTEMGAVWPLLKRFWQQYAEQRGFTPKATEAALATTLRYTVVRLIQSAIERNGMMTTLQPNAIKLLQVSHSMQTSLDRLPEYFPASQPLAYA